MAAMKKSKAECCMPRQNKFIAVEAFSIPELGKLLVRDGQDKSTEALIHHCRDCGQTWEEHSVGFHHASVYVVVKQGIEPSLPGTPGGHNGPT
jgi:hypothetical protein